MRDARGQLLGLALVLLVAYGVTSSPVRVVVGQLVRGLRNNNPGNLRANAFTGFLRIDADGYAIFDTLDNGIRAAARQLLLFSQRGITTVRSIVSTWAPASENDTQAYIDSVSQAIGRGRDSSLQLDESTHLALLRAIFRRELGAVPAATISDAAIVAGIRRAA